MNPSPVRVFTANSNEQKSRETAEFREIVKNASNDFSNRERTFFLNQSASNLEKLNDGRQDWYAAAHLRHHGEIMLTLSSVKPCTLIVHGACQNIFTNMVNECLKPVVETYKLHEYGFILQQIRHKMPTTAHLGFQHGWILADTKSPKWPAVKNIFLIPHPGKKADELEIGKALGYPTRDLGGDLQVVTYKDYTEERRLNEELKGEKVCCVDGVEYFCSGDNAVGDLPLVARHFDTCEEAAKAVGWKFVIDLTYCPDLKSVGTMYGAWSR